MKKPIFVFSGIVLLLCACLFVVYRAGKPSPSPNTKFTKKVGHTETTAALVRSTSGLAASTAQLAGAANASAAITNAEPLVEFRTWIKSYISASPAERAAMVAQGVALAEARRPVMKQLIRENPRLAVEQAVSLRLRQELPTEVLMQLEERVSGRAALRVYQGVGADNRSPVPTFHVAEFASGKTYQAHVYGRRAEGVRWVAGASLNGPALDGDLALNDDPICSLEVGYVPPPAAPATLVCPVSGEIALEESDRSQPITEDTPALEAFGEIVYLCNGAHAIIYREQLIYAEGGTGGPLPFTGILPAAPTPSIGNVRVLVIPMTFADQNDTPSTESVLYQLMRDVGDHYAKASYGKLTLLTTVTPPIKLPHNEAWYIQKDTSNGGPIDGLGLEHSHARAEARKLGFDDAEYDCVVVRLRGGPRPVGGYGGGASVWIYGDGVDVTAHEVGHSFGLAHANYWDTSGTSAIGAGANQEYGGHFDVMGGVGLPRGHYNAAGKNQIKWLPDAFVTEVTGSGVYRIYAQDQAVLDPSKRFALKVRKDSLRTYWGELRGLWTGDATRTWADYGLILNWKYPGGSGGNVQLIDTTPGTPFGKDDSPISLGRTFSDTEAGIHFTTIAVNQAANNEIKSVDVVVNLGAFTSNHPPTLALAASATVVPLNVPITFTATANDVDGDVLAYSWQNFGDANYRTILPNAPVIARTFTVAGTYVVSCTVSDMKGGAATRNVLITAGNGGGRFTISGRVTLGGQGLANVLVNANSANGVVTDSDGYYTIPNLAAATYVMTPLLYGYSFAELFNNSVTVGPNFSGADFEASASPLVTITAAVPTANEANAGAPALFVLTRDGDASQPLVVSVASPVGTAVSGTDYTLAPALGSGSLGFSTATIPAGTNSLSLTITPINDSLVEGPETVTLQLGPGIGYLIDGLAQATVVIDDDDTTLPKVSLAVGEAKTVEGSSAPATIAFTRIGVTTGALAVAYLVSGTATTNTDFLPLSGTLTIPVGQSSASLSITSINDSVSEQLETVVIRLGSIAFIADPVANSATVSIVDDDVQVVTVAATDVVASERDLSPPSTIADTATFLVTRTGDISQPLTIYYATSGTNSGTVATALHGVDYESLAGVLVIPAGQSGGAITIIPRWDGLGEGSESVTLQLGAGPTNYRLGIPNAATITINDAGDPPYVEVLGVDNATESGTTGRFRFSVKGSSSSNVVVNYSIGGTATNSVDYTGLSGTVSISGNGVNTVDVSVTAINDGLAEDLETISVTITPNPAYQVFAPSSSATIWLYDAQTPTLFVDAHSTGYPPSFSENGSGGFFYISRSGSTNAATTVNYVMSGTAVNGTDYQLLSGTTNIAAGALGVDLQVTPINDGIAEGTETVVLTLAPGAYGRGAPAAFYLTDDETPTVAVGFPFSSAASAESAGTIDIPVTLSATSAAPITIEYLVETGGRATTTANGSVPASLPYWVKCERINSTFIGSISQDGTNWTGVSTQTIAVPTSSYVVGLCVNSYNVSLLSTSVFDNVIISNLQPGATVSARASLNLGTTALAGGSTVVGSNYTVWGAGDNVEGTTDQGHFTYWTIGNSTNCTLTARVVSQQNTHALATAGVMIREGTANNVRRGFMAATPGSGFEFHYRTAPAGTEAKVTAFAGPPIWLRLQRAGDVFSAFQSNDGATWTQVSTNLTVAFGSELLAGIMVSGQVEGTLATGTFDNVGLTPGPLPALLGRTVGFTALQGSDTQAGGVYTVTGSGDGVNGSNDDCYFVSAPVFGDFVFTARVVSMLTSATAPQAGVLVRESTRRTARSILISGVPGGTPVLSWRTTTITAGYGDGLDYTLAPGLLTFAPGVSTQNVSVVIANDTIPEPDEPVTIILRNAWGARLGAATQFTLDIIDDDAAPAQPFTGFAATNSSAAEASGVAQVPVTLSIPATAAASVDYIVAAGTATDGIDFLAGSGTLNFAVGDTVKFVPVTLLDDAVIEAGKTVLLTLSNAVGLRFNTQTNHTLTILDDDSPVVTISSADTNAAETGGTALVTLVRTGPTNNALTVNLSRTGTATVTTDWTGINATELIPAGVTNLTLTITAVQDPTAEGTETVIITVAAGSGYVVGAPSSVTNFIADDDRNTVTITADGPLAVEGGTNGSLTLTRAGATNASLNVSLSVSGTATSGTDYTNTPTPITTVAFAAGQTARTILIHPINDAITEGDETVLVQISAGSYDIGGAGYASVAIQDNDIPPTVFISSHGAQRVVIELTNGMLFEATADDDGTPQPLTYQWSQVSGPGVVTFLSSNTAASPAMFTATGVYLVRVTVSDGQFSVSDQITVNIGLTNSLTPAEWISTDFGPPTLRGFSGPSGSNTLLSVTGTGFTTGTDRGHAMSRQITGDGSIVARLDSVTGPNAAEAGLSVRDSLHRYSRRGSLVYSNASKVLRFRARLVANTTDFSFSVTNLNLPLWLRLDRNAASNTVAAFYATNNAGAPGPWVQIGTNVNITMDATADYSLTGASGSDTVSATALFGNVALTPAVSGPAIMVEDFGPGTQAGTYTYDSGTDTHTLVGQGSLDGSGLFRGGQFTGDFILTVLQLDATSNANDARSGIMIRDSMDNGAMVFFGRNPQGAFGCYVWRTNPGGGTASLNGVTQKQRWFRLIRRGNTVTALHAPNSGGVPGAWVQLGNPQTVFLQPSVVAGLYCDNAGGVGFNTATFTKLTIVPLHKAPIVNAGATPTNTTPPLALAGTVTDDGLPNAFTTEWTVAAGPGPVTFANSNLLATSATYSNSGAFTLRLWADDGLARSFDDLNFNHSSATPFQMWQAANFAGGPANTNAAPGLDPDGDGMNNAGEYVFGTDPNIAGPHVVVPSIATNGPNQFLRVTIPKNPAATDATITVEASTEIAPATWSAAGLIIETNTPTLLQVRDHVPLSPDSHRFFRVSVTLN